MNSASTSREQKDSRPRVGLSISIDTEEDNWAPTREGVTVTNIQELPKLADLFASLGVRATYFVTYQVAAAADSAAVLRDLHERGTAEIGAHLHPWNTPPDSGIEQRVTMLRDYPPDSQRLKLERLLEEFDRSLGMRPTSFRAGRFGMGRDMIARLIQSGIYVDSSVTPLLSWESNGGPSFIGAPSRLYRLDGRGDIRIPVDSGELVEVPITVGFTRFSPSSWARIAESLAAPGARSVHALGIASHLGFLRRVVLSPETHSVGDMLRVSRRFIHAGAPFLHLFFHSNSLQAGLTPFVRTEGDLDHLYDSLRRYVEGLQRMADVDFYTVSEAAAALGPQRAATPGPVSIDSPKGVPGTRPGESTE
jgi:hypothetical protein